MSKLWDIFHGELLFGLSIWLPATFVLWLHMGYSPAFFFSAGWTFLFCLMIVEDFFHQTVDMRLAVVLFAVTGMYTYVENGMETFGRGCLMGLYISLLVFVLGIRVDENAGNEGTRESKNTSGILAMQMGFVPSMGIAIALWFFVGDYVIDWMEAMSAIANSLAYLWIESIAIFSFFTAAICFFQYHRIRKLRRREKRKTLTVGFGEGDILVCLIVGGFLGWQGFLFVFVAALCVHVMMIGTFFLEPYGRKLLIPLVSARKP